jgi:hypothetical protein
MSLPPFPGLVMYRPGWSGGLPLAVGCYCHRKTAPVEGPRRITRVRWSEEPVVTRRLGGSAEMLLDRGSIVWLLLHTRIFEHRPKYTLPGMLPCVGMSMTKLADRVDL